MLSVEAIPRRQRYIKVTSDKEWLGTNNASIWDASVKNIVTPANDYNMGAFKPTQIKH